MLVVKILFTRKYIKMIYIYIYIYLIFDIYTLKQLKYTKKILFWNFKKKLKFLKNTMPNILDSGVVTNYNLYEMACPRATAGL
jgi:hypothetical protein